MHAARLHHPPRAFAVQLRLRCRPRRLFCGAEVVAGALRRRAPRARAQNPPDWQEILTYFRGSELQNYFTKILEDNIKAIIKPQYVDHIPKVGPRRRPLFTRDGGMRWECAAALTGEGAGMWLRRRSCVCMPV